jgi:ABC-type Fe3+/spermidine/putrescine transport system ATPase subunit
MEPVLELSEVTKRFGDFTAVSRMSFALVPGEFFTLLGPSGCGKTTTLRLIAGLEWAEEGEILLNGAPIMSPQRGIFVPPDKRGVGMVFQSYAIWPHLTVFENVAFPLRVRRETAQVARKRVAEALELVGLGGLGERGATELSGGQQQRVALARALVYTPTLLLLDEPLSNLDAKLREQMRFELRALQQRLKIPVVYVTHDQAEAMTLSDRIAVMYLGRLEQVGTPDEVYEKPATPFVGDFLGRTVVLEGTLKRTKESDWIELSEGNGRLSRSNGWWGEFTEGEKVRVISRPEDIEILPMGELGPNHVLARVQEVAYLGDHFEYNVSTVGRSFVLPAGKKKRYPIGSEVRLALDPERLTVLRG